MITQIRKEDIRFRWKRRNSYNRTYHTLTAIVTVGRKYVRVTFEEVDLTVDAECGILLKAREIQEANATKHILENQEKLWRV